MNQKQIRDSLLQQLTAKGANLDHFENLLEDYCYYWALERKMQADVRKKGMTYLAISAVGKEYEKENPSVKAAVMYNQQKLKILHALGLTTESAPPPAGGSDAGHDPGL